MANNFKKADRFIQRVTVRFKEDVDLVEVLDVMRDDHCVPATQGDASKLARVAGGLASPMERVVAFTRTGETKHVLTRAWSAAGGEVLAIQHPDAEPYTVGASA